MIHLLLLLIYLSFISLGLPDSLLGSAWPEIHQKINVPISYAGILTATSCMFTIVSSLLSAKLTKKFGTGLVIVFSTFLTAFALMGFCLSNSFILLVLFSIPYGLGAGGIDAALNNYVAVHFKAKHMSWLHAMWGIGATIGPYVMGFVLTNNNPYNEGYLIISIIQFVLMFILMLSLPLWKKMKTEETDEKEMKVLNFKEIFNIKGVLIVIITFFCYCALEQTAMFWASTYLVENNKIDIATAALLASLVCIGITVGRIINGFIAMKLKDKDMIRIGTSIIFIGVLFLILDINNVVTYIGFILIGLGCSPIYPSIIHSTPTYFGEDVSQSLIGVQMAGAYIGVLLMPPLFGVIADFVSIKLLPFYLLFFLVVLIVCHERLLRIIKI